MLIYRILTKNKKRRFEVYFDVVWSTIKLGKDKHVLVDNPAYNKPNDPLSGFRYFRASSVSFKQHWTRFQCQGDYPECFSKAEELLRKSSD